MSFARKATSAALVFGISLAAVAAVKLYGTANREAVPGTSPNNSVSTNQSGSSSPAPAPSSPIAIREYQPGWRFVMAKATIDGSPHPGVDVKTQNSIEHCGKEPLADTVENRAKGEVWLTFDDYGSESQIIVILDALKQKGVRGRFFLKGDWAEANPAIIQRIVNEGHFIGNHTRSHQALFDVKSAHDGDTWQVRDQDESIIRSEISQGMNSTILRPPYGAYDLRVMQILDSIKTDDGKRITICTWTNDSEDWNRNTTPTASSELERIKRGTTPNGVVLFHAHGRFTGQILPDYIGWLRENGYNLEKLN
ncbi:MAG: polysaccharide deacetylase family protein [Candidatus Woesebacteria bacterium]|jgi:peptidoglycan/xylan/chitin deacetylase (PgdA/CDA1 family)